MLLLLGTEYRLIMNLENKRQLRLALHFLIDSFSTDLWKWGPVGKPTKSEQDSGAQFNHYNVHKSVVRLVHEFFPGEMCPSVKTWDEDKIAENEKVTNRERTSDNHLNMLHRIQLIPPTFRGNQMRKYLAFMYLQTLAEIEGYNLPTHIDVSDLTDTYGKFIT